MASINKACEKSMMGRINYYQYALDQDYFGNIHKEILTTGVAFSFPERIGELLLKTKIANVKLYPEKLFVKNKLGQDVRLYRGFHTGLLR